VIFGFGLSNKSFNGLPVDSNWLASYLTRARWRHLSALVLLLVLVSAFFMPRGKSKALALFLAVYVLIASLTETGSATPPLTARTHASRVARNALHLPDEFRRRKPGMNTSCPSGSR